MVWIDRDCIVWIFSSTISFFLIFSTVWSMSFFFLCYLISVDIDLLQLPLLLFPNFSSAEYDPPPSCFDFILTWSYFKFDKLLVILVFLQISFIVLSIILETCSLYSILLLFWICNFSFLFFSNLFDFSLSVVLDMVCNTFPSMRLISVTDDNVLLSLLWPLKWDISSSEYNIPNLLRLLLTRPYFKSELLLLLSYRDK